MNMNWGYKIMWVYIVFIAGISFMVFMASGQNQDLVTSDYYEQELKFQQKIDQTIRANALSSPVNSVIKGNEIVIGFPKEMSGAPLSAKILLYCIADKNKDVQRDFVTNNGEIHFVLPPENKGLHELKVTWKVNDIDYYYQHKIMIK